MYRAVIFDLDGTLLNTLDDLAASTNAALAAHGLAPRSLDEVRGFVGNGYANLIARAVPANTTAAVTASVFTAFQHHYALHSADTTAPYAGVLDLLHALKSAGCKLAIVSNKGDAAVQALVAHYFPGLIDVAVGEREGIRRKPAPDSVRAVMQQLQVNPQECVYVGDSEVDVATAAAADLACICVTWGFRDVATLRASGATTLVDTCSEARRILLG